MSAEDATSRAASLDKTASCRRVALPDVNLFLTEEGSGRLVVLLHGITANAYVWRPIQRGLASRYHVVAADQRGHGRTGPARSGGYAATDFALDVAALIRALSGRHAILVGHSLGARNALTAAQLYPDCVAGVVAVDFTPYIEPRVFDALQSRVQAGNRVFADHQALSGYLRERYPLLPDEAIERRATYGYHKDENGWLKPHADPDAMTSACAWLKEDLRPTVTGLDVPTLFVRGAKSTLVSSKSLAQTRKLRPDFGYRVLDGCDHYVPEEKPEVLAQAVEEFIEDVDTTG